MRMLTPTEKKNTIALFAALLWATSMAGQTPQTPTVPKPIARAASVRPPSQVDSVIQMVKAGLSEGLIVKSLQKQNKPANLTAADMVKLKNAGVSENIIGVMMDPASAPSSAAPVPAPEAAPANPPPSEPVVSAPPVPQGPPSAAVLKAQKKRVTVDEFDYSAVMTSIQAIFGTQQNIGKGIRAMLTTRLGQQGKLVIVERAKIKNVMNEQDLDNSNRVKKGTGSRTGIISGSDALLTGDVVIFGRDDKHTKIRGGGITGSVLGGIMNAKGSDKAVVAIDYRLVDGETSEIIATGEARGESERKSSTVGGFGGAWGKGFGGAEIDMTSSNFAQTIIGEATQDCVNKLADILNTQTENMKRNVREVEAMVADVAGNTLVINAGTADGVTSGDVFEVMRIVRDVKDPSTQEVLDRITEKTGEMTITTVKEKVATGVYSGAAVKKGFLVRKKIG